MALQRTARKNQLRSGSAVPKHHAARGWPTSDGRTISCPLGVDSPSDKAATLPPSPKV